MAVKRIVKYGEKILTQRTKKVDYEKLKEKLPEILEDMYDTMEAVGGIGLAANQIGLDLQLAVIKYEDKDSFKKYDIVIINPEIVDSDGSTYEEEGCLSFPGFFVKVKRFARVKVRALNQKGLPVEIKAEGLLAKALQHEIDHLNGITFIDRLPLAQKLKLKPTLLKLKRQWKKIDESKLKPDIM